MQELRLVAVSEDGSYAVLVVPGRSGRFALPIDERLRTVARGQFSRLAQYEIEVESPLRPKEIQDRIRAGETAEDIADAAGLPVDRIRRFEGPVLAEREFRAQEAQRATVRGRGDSGPGPRLGEVVAQRLAEAGASTDEVEWDSRKRQDGNWQIQIAYTVAGRLQLAEWVFDPRSRHVTADDDQAARLSLPEADWPPARPGARGPVTATVTPIGSRTGSASLHQADQRPGSDRAADRGPLHPSRQIPAAAAASPGGTSSGQAAGQGRKPGLEADIEAAVASPPPVPAARQSARGRVSMEIAAAAAGHQGATGPGQEDLAGGPAAGPADEAEAIAPPARRASGGRSRRSSVPSWDEIMFGNSRQTE
ncbi:MAG TPA: septation protein SepH [Streptosporangiaceae bacterium]|nr:septation protein SepH [Streptosporangiaceae bacterium]